MIPPERADGPFFLMVFRRLNAWNNQYSRSHPQAASTTFYSGSSLRRASATVKPVHSKVPVAISDEGRKHMTRQQCRANETDAARARPAGKAQPWEMNFFTV
jgi:hypothetical protein